MKEGKITDETRIRDSSYNSIFSRAKSAKVILASHLGRPKGQ